MGMKTTDNMYSVEGHGLGVLAVSGPRDNYRVRMTKRQAWDLAKDHMAATWTDGSRRYHTVKVFDGSKLVFQAYVTEGKWMRFDLELGYVAIAA